MATPFENWFSADWRKLLHDGLPDDREVLSSGLSIRGASWDRRAAYLHWVALGRPNAEWATIYPIKAADDDIDLLAGPTPAADDDMDDLLS